jgi:two-component system, LytTR family, response regulator
VTRELGVLDAKLREMLAESRRLAALLERMESLAVVGASPSHASKHFADRLVVKKNERTTLVKVADVQWIESKGNYVMLHTAHGELLLRETLARLESRLDPDMFVRIHRRTIVAIDAIKEVHPWFWGDQVLILRDGRQLRVSRTLRQRVARRLAGQG